MIISVLFLNFIPSTDNNNQTRVIIEFNSIYTDLNLLYLKILGYDFEMNDKLRNVMHGAVINITTDQIDRLKNETITSNVFEEKFLKTNLDKSVKLIGADYITVRDYVGRELTGKDVRIAIIDTGIDYTHSDLFGFGKDGKVVGGYDFLMRDEAPMDTDGHGTLVAGIIAADGNTKGVAPKAELIAYRIASDGDYVSTTDMIKALDRAVEDEIDVVNISLGLDYISEEIDSAIKELVSRGIVVVTAAGNNGQTKQIGSPASASSAISVGASLNNVSMSAVSTLKISSDTTKYNVIPMIGSAIPKETVIGNLVFGKFAKVNDLKDIDIRGAIVLVERGGPITEINGEKQMEIVYFTDKEINAVKNGAAALIVYNNTHNIYRGSLINNKSPIDYKPSIPVVSMSMEEGLVLRNLIENGSVDAELNIFYNPDIVASFSSRGPVSPFYLKPTLVAPGAFINSTSIRNSYNVTSGTSFAAPHVTGTVALLLQKNPELIPSDIASILTTTAKPVNDVYGSPYSFNTAGAGRLDVDAALRTNIIATPYYIIIHLFEDKEVSKKVVLKSLDDILGKLKVNTAWDEPIVLDTHIESIESDTANLIINAKLSEHISGKYEGRIYVEDEQNKITIPVIVYVDEIGLNVNNNDGKIWLSIDSEESWTFANVKVTNEENRHGYSVTLTPSDNLQSVPARNVGEYWIEANVVTNYGDKKGFSVLNVSNVTTDNLFYDYLGIYGIPLKEVFIIISFLGFTAVVVYVWTKRNNSENRVSKPLS